MKDEYMIDNIGSEEKMSSEDYIASLVNPLTQRALLDELKFSEYAGLLL